MAGKLLQWIGVFFVLGLLGAAAVGFMVLKDRVRIVVQSDQPNAGPDATALLRDDVQVLARDLDALQTALVSNFEQLGRAFEERAEARHGEVVAMRQELPAARQRLEGLASDVAVLRTEVQSLSAGPASSAANAATALAAEPPAGSPDRASVERLTVEPAREWEPAPDTRKPAAKAAGFLSFSLPSTQFRFDAPQDYVLVPELCRVGFDAKSTLHDFTGVTSNVKGHFRADFDDPAGAWTGEVAAEASSLVTGVEGRDTNMVEYLDVGQHARIRFVVERFRPADSGIDTKKQTARGDLVGQMTIRGETRELTMPVQIEVDPQKRVVVTGQVALKLSDYAVPVPSQLGVINMHDEVTIWIALRARMQAETKK
ncbi:MAG: YceI family protein [Planctomycetota bacterium]